MSDRRDKTRSKSKSRDRERSSRRDREAAMQQTLSSILSRLNDLESNRAGAPYTVTTADLISNRMAESSNPILRDSTMIQTSRNENNTCVRHEQLNCNSAVTSIAEGPESVLSELPTTTPQTDISNTTASQNESSVTESARILAEAIKSLSQNHNQSYFVSCFDPAIHDIDVWCEEVERARLANNWRDSECLSRVSGCLKGDARVWLTEWVTCDRTWSNFIREFKPLCPRRLDYANILYDTMQTNSDKFTSYAEYARRTLLRLRIIKGLTDELRVLIVIRGINDAQVRAAASNAKLTCDDLVSFLAIYAKPTPIRPETQKLLGNSKRPLYNQFSNTKCHSCKEIGHKMSHCPKKSKINQGPSQDTYNARDTFCSFCKKPGHTESSCFAKDRSTARNSPNVTSCTNNSDTI